MGFREDPTQWRVPLSSTPEISSDLYFPSSWENTFSKQKLLWKAEDTDQYQDSIRLSWPMEDEIPFIQPDHCIPEHLSWCIVSQQLSQETWATTSTKIHYPQSHNFPCYHPFPSKTGGVPYLHHSQEPLGMEESDHVSSSIEWPRQEHVRAIRPGLRVAVAWPLFLRSKPRVL